MCDFVEEERRERGRCMSILCAFPPYLKGRWRPLVWSP